MVFEYCHRKAICGTSSGRLQQCDDVTISECMELADIHESIGVKRLSSTSVNTGSATGG